MACSFVATYPIDCDNMPWVLNQIFLLFLHPDFKLYIYAETNSKVNLVWEILSVTTSPGLLYIIQDSITTYCTKHRHLFMQISPQEKMDLWLTQRLIIFTSQRLNFT